MKELRLCDKIKIRIKEGVWLKEKIEEFNSLGIKDMYYGDSANGVEQVYLVKEVNEKINVTLIARHQEHIMYYPNDDGIYICSFNGIYYKPADTDTIEKIVDGKYISGLRIIPHINTVIIKGDFKDEILRLHKSKIIERMQLQRIANINGKREYSGYVDKINTKNKEIPIIAEENGYYAIYIISEEGIRRNDLLFEDYESALQYLNGDIAIAEIEGRKYFVSLNEKNNDINIHFSADIIKFFESNYYYSTNENEEFSKLLYVKENEFLEIAQISNGDYKEIFNQNGIEILKMKNKEGVTLVAICGKKAKQVFYPGAYDVLLSEPSLFEGESIFSVKPTILYQK